MRIRDAHRGAIPMEPWPHLLELAAAWDTGESQVVLKARQLGVSWLLAAFALYRAREMGSTVLALSQGEAEAFELLDKARFINEALPADLSLRADVDRGGELAFVGGGRIIALPATQRAGRGYTATLVIADEAAFHPWAAKNYAAYKPTLDGGGQLLMVSTANGSAGNFFYDLYWQSDRGETPYAARFIPWSARPGRDAAWLARERAAFVGLPSEFDQEYPHTPESAFVQLTGLVYPQWSRERHVRPDPCAWKDCLDWYAGYDLGGGDPTAIVYLGVYLDPRTRQRRVHQFGESYYKRGTPGLDWFNAELGRWAKDVRLRIEPDPVGVAAVFAETLRGSGFRVSPTKNAKREEGLGVVGMYLENDWLTISPDCRESIHEFAGYRWRDNVDPNTKDRFATSTPVDHHADAMDARRYALMGIYLDEMNRTGSGAPRGVKVLW